MHVVVIHGSPSEPSRSSALADELVKRLGHLGIASRHARLGDFSPAALLSTDITHPAIQSYLQAVKEANGIIIATPIYTGSISALTKALLEVIPERGLRGKPALVLANGGSAASVQAAEHALSPILRNLKATLLGASVYSAASDLTAEKDSNGNTLTYYLSDDISARLDEALDHFVAQLANNRGNILPQTQWASRLAL